MNTSNPTQPSQEALLNALAQARLMILEMGNAIRHLDEDSRYFELWSNDGAYVPDKRFRVLDALVPPALKPDLQPDLPETLPKADDAAEAEPGCAFVVVQQGGSSSEVYIHAASTHADAEAFREECERGAYETSDVIEVPAVLAAHGETLYEVLEAVAQAAIEFP